MKKSEILHILRNPWGSSEAEIKEARLAACERIEDLSKAYINMRKAYINMRNWAEENGIDTATYSEDS